MRYKYIKIIQSTLCDEHILEDDIKLELVEKIIKSCLNCNIKVKDNRTGMIRSYKQVKLLKVEKNEIYILIQEKSGSFNTSVSLSNLLFLEVKSIEDLVSIDNQKNRYQFLDC